MNKRRRELRIPIRILSLVLADGMKEKAKKMFVFFYIPPFFY
jgi:hypothetical protein